MQINIVSILGSVRHESHTANALQIVLQNLAQQKDVKTRLICAAEFRLYPPGVIGSDSQAMELRQIVSAAHGVILATPEYHGSFSSLMKLVIENLGYPSALAKKPVALLGVAGGRIGAIKSLEHLASVCLHVGAIVLPGPISIAHSAKVFDTHGNCLDEEVAQSLRQLGDRLVRYIRETTCPDISMEEMVREK